MIYILRSYDIEFQDIYLTNSMSFHLKMDDVKNVYCHDFEIFADIMGQLEISKLFAQLIQSPLEWGLELPIFPLNTDGIDPSG